MCTATGWQLQLTNISYQRTCVMLLTRASLWRHGGPAGRSVHSTDCLASRDRISPVTPKQEVLQSYNFVALLPRLSLVLASIPGLIPSKLLCAVRQVVGSPSPLLSGHFSAGLNHSFRRKPWDRSSGASPHTELVTQRCPNSAICPIRLN